MQNSTENRMIRQVAAGIC